MTLEQAQQYAPAYLRLPNDGAPYKCAYCGEYRPHNKVIIHLTPDKRLNWGVFCIDNPECTDTWWLAHAKDCGVIS